MQYVLLIGCPAGWSENQVQLMADRLMADALPEACSVAYADAAQVDLPVTSALLRTLGRED